MRICEKGRVSQLGYEWRNTSKTQKIRNLVIFGPRKKILSQCEIFLNDHLVPDEGHLWALVPSSGGLVGVYIYFVGFAYSIPPRSSSKRGTRFFFAAPVYICTYIYVYIYMYTYMCISIFVNII